MITNENIDNGRAFDWGRTSLDYAKYRDIYPREFYRKIVDYDLCNKGQFVLDIGTGTGVLPRNLYSQGAKFTGIDSSRNQIGQAIELAEKEHMDIVFQCVPAENCEFAEETFHVVTACQCFTYFDHAKLAPLLSRLLKANGKLAILYMAWLPYEDAIAGKSEELILKYNPAWTGCREKRRLNNVPEIYKQYFTVERQEIFDLPVPFTRESWHGRVKTCRGIEASLSEQEVNRFDREHTAMLNENAPQNFNVLHYAAITILEKRVMLPV